jgi:choline dehydrogenase
LFKSGLGTTNYFETGAFLRTDDRLKIPNFQYEFIPVMGEFQEGSVALANGFQYIFALMRPTSRGRVWIDSVDPRAAPKFVFNYLSTKQDQDEAVAAVKITRDIVSQSAWEKFRNKEVVPGPDVETDQDILGYLRRTISTQYHPCGTCRMGHDPMSVVNELGRVHEMDNLRIVDASIMPSIVSGNLNAPVIMIAEKLSDSLLGRPPLPPEHVAYYRA